MRLPVILVQNAPASGVSLAEDLVGNLIGRAGLDLTLVDRFDSLQEHSTDRMTLEGITVPSAVLDWQSESDMLESLSKIGFRGTRTPHQLDPDGGASQGESTRRLFLFDLTKLQNATAIIAELDRLRTSLSVKTVSLGGIAKSPGNGRTQSGEVSSDNETSATSSPVPSTESHSVQRPPERELTTPELGTSRSNDNLDALIDQLDDLDV